MTVLDLTDRHSSEDQNSHGKECSKPSQAVDPNIAFIEFKQDPRPNQPSTVFMQALRVGIRDQRWKGKYASPWC